MLILRFVWIVIKSLFGKRETPLATVRTTHRAWLSDCDPNFHLNEGRYLTASGMGRVNLMVRIGLSDPILKKGWRPAAAGALIQYFRSIPPLARYHIDSRILTWDEKYLIFEHCFEYAGHPVARILVRALFRHGRTNIPPAEVMTTLGYGGPTPEPGEEIRIWDQLRAIQRPVMRPT